MYFIFKAFMYALCASILVHNWAEVQGTLAEIDIVLKGLN